MWGLTQVDALKMFQEDEGTDAVVLLGEIGGSMEEAAAEYIKENVTKPVVALIVGRHAPEGEKMGHAGAIIEHGRGTAESKLDSLRKAGVLVVKGPREIPSILKELI
jgi:succinyl-CoA synthetase alpha subunit